jgi:PST family polysaccharide transporter
VWALVVQTVIQPAFASVGFLLQSRYRPRLRFSMERLRSIFAFSRHMLGIMFTTFLNQRTDDFLIGAVIGSVALGIYTVAYRLLTVMLDVVVTSAQDVLFPAFSRVQDDRSRLARAYLSASGMGAVLASPSFLFVLAAAPELVHVVFGTKWDEAIPVMQVLCLFGPLQAIMQLNYALLNSMGRPRLVFRVGMVGTVLQVAAFAVAVHFGIVWVAASFVLASRELQFSMAAFLRRLLPSTLATAAMVAAMYGLRAVLPADLSDWLRLLALSATAPAAYFAALRVVGREQLGELTRYGRAAIGR